MSVATLPVAEANLVTSGRLARSGTEPAFVAASASAAFAPAGMDLHDRSRAGVSHHHVRAGFGVEDDLRRRQIDGIGGADLDVRPLLVPAAKTGVHHADERAADHRNGLAGGFIHTQSNEDREPVQIDTDGVAAVVHNTGRTGNVVVGDLEVRATGVDHRDAPRVGAAIIR